ncbi:hypothetical protein [Flavisolibacter tropicus]|nr:hypothetical protein [Flavisolibacter tropicus]
MAFSLDPKKKYYNRLFERKTYIFHLALGCMLSILGFYRIKYINFQEVGYFMPLLFLLFFRLFDWVVLKMQGRHILVVTKGDRVPSDYKWWTDGLFTLLSMITPILVSSLILMKLKQNPGILGGPYKDAVKIDLITNQ